MENFQSAGNQLCRRKNETAEKINCYIASFFQWKTSWTTWIFLAIGFCPVLQNLLLLKPRTCWNRRQPIVAERRKKPSVTTFSVCYFVNFKKNPLNHRNDEKLIQRWAGPSFCHWVSARRQTNPDCEFRESFPSAGVGLARNRHFFVWLEEEPGNQGHH